RGPTEQEIDLVPVARGAQPAEPVEHLAALRLDLLALAQPLRREREGGAADAAPLESEERVLRPALRDQRLHAVAVVRRGLFPEGGFGLAVVHRRPAPPVQRRGGPAEE